jgi:hypothetical protein
MYYTFESSHQHSFSISAWCDRFSIVLLCLGPVRQQRLSVRSRNSRFNTVLERVTRIELVRSPWQGDRLPLHHTRIINS